MTTSFFIQQYQPFLNRLKHYPELAELSQQLPHQITYGLRTERYGDIPKWQQVLAALPRLTGRSILHTDTVTVSGELITDDEKAALTQLLKTLKPWRKGPFQLFDIKINTEWRSDWKWQRLEQHISPLTGRKVLDVGCGSGYHCWRMRGAGAELVIGIDPSPLFIMQFLACQNYIQDHQVGVLPMGIEHLPATLESFDTVFSMGVLYHRRSPIDHLQELKDALRRKGELVIETLVVAGETGYSLMPRGRYACMGNVWFIPSTATLISWLEKLGFIHICVIDETRTSLEEQRVTEWMDYQSLADFLDPNDRSKTKEGYPAPQRAIVKAIKP